jgi:hypothetical protein
MAGTLTLMKLKGYWLKSLQIIEISILESLLGDGYTPTINSIRTPHRIWLRSEKETTRNMMFMASSTSAPCGTEMTEEMSRFVG